MSNKKANENSSELSKKNLPPEGSQEVSKQDSSPVSQHASKPRIAVIGGGISGLAAAHRIYELYPEADLTLYEAGDRIGGVLQTENRDGYLLEKSADNFITKMPWALDLCKRIGFADQLIRTAEGNRRALVIRAGQVQPIPEAFVMMAPHKIWPVITTPVLSWLGKLRLMMEPLIKKGPKQDESVTSFCSRRLGKETFDRLIQPLFSGIYTADPAKLSMQATMPQFLNQEQESGSLVMAGLKTRRNQVKAAKKSGAQKPTADSGARYSLFMAPKNGMTSMVQAIAKQLPQETIQLGAEVKTILKSPDGRWSLQFTNGKQETFDGLIIATPARYTTLALKKMDPELSENLGRISYASTSIVALGVKRSQVKNLPAGFGFVVPIIEKRNIIATSFSSVKYQGRAPEEELLIRTFVGGALQPELLKKSDTELIQLVTDELAELIGLSGTPVMAEVLRWEGVMPQYHVGHVQLVDQIEQQTKKHPGLELAGNSYRGIGVPQCVRSGETAAQQLVEYLKTSRN